MISDGDFFFHALAANELKAKLEEKLFVTNVVVKLKTFCCNFINNKPFCKIST